ncbi:MAG: LysR family transcriptional regulator [Deltaproteobacteria bacterium]|nr:LysR family transcriptional regulator [Deltaproteobacteria bacterium]
MELNQLDCFMAVLEEGSFNRAATRMHRTQPAISYQIKQLEDEVGMSLFHRRPRRVSPTDAGRLLAQHAQEVIAGVRRARGALAELSHGVAGEVRIGTVNSVGIHFLPEVLWAVREKYPEIRTTVLYRESGAIMEALLSSRIDLALVANPRQDRRLRQETIIQERVSLVCGASHPFFGRKAVRPSELRGLRFVALTPEHPTGQLVRDFLARLGVDVEPVVSTANVETVKKMVEVGLGVAFLPDMVTAGEVSCNGHPAGRLARIEVGPPLVRSIALVSWRNAEPSRAVAAFIELLQAHGRRWRGCHNRPNAEAGCIESAGETHRAAPRLAQAG